MKKSSAGILLYELEGSSLRVLLVHPGGPLWAKKDLGAWSVPKGEYEEPEDPYAAALREFEEETGRRLEPGDVRELIPLGTVHQANGKAVIAWAIEGAFDVSALVSNTFQLEWPKGTGLREFPEVDRAAWFDPAVARRKVIEAQAEFVDRLVTALRERGHEVHDPSLS